MSLEICDCSRFDHPLAALDASWLMSLAASCQASQVLIGLGGRQRESEPVVYCEHDGSWWAGRYVGVVSHEDRTLTVKPRFGMKTLAHWLGVVYGAAIVETPGRLRGNAPFVAQLLGHVWGVAFAEAARHGLPSFRRDATHCGTVVRGRLDVQASLQARAAGREGVVSVSREKYLNNPVGRILIAAYGVLRRWLGRDEEWLPDRVQELVPILQAATGLRPTVPDENELTRVRYTPINRGYKRIVALSLSIIRMRGLLTEPAEGQRTCGVLLDVAELWELFVLAALRRAAGAAAVRHGTREPGWGALLTSAASADPLSELRPDAIIDSNNATGILDAKYKSLRPRAQALRGPLREDLYQAAAYLSRRGVSWGALVYPEMHDNHELPPVEVGNPWRLETGN